MNRDPLIGREGVDRQRPLNRTIPEFVSFALQSPSLGKPPPSLTLVRTGRIDAPSIKSRPGPNRALLLTPVNAGPALARYKAAQIDGEWGYQPVTIALFLSGPSEDEGLCWSELR